MRVAAALTAAAGVVVCAASAPACSLGLDESLIDAGPVDSSIGKGDDAPGITPPADAPADVAKPLADAATCTLDGDCTSLSACRSGHCVGGHCMYTVCPTSSACQGSTCLAATNTCSPPASYGFHAGAVHVAAGAVGCGGDPARCLAAAFPFVFVGTANGVVAYAMNDPSNESPPTVPVTGLPFLPYALVGVGSRVYFVGNVTGSGPTYKLPIGWIDVQADPMVTELRVTTVLESYPHPGAFPFAGTGGGLYLVDLDAAKFYPAAYVTAPLKDGASIASFPSPGVATNAGPVVASGARLTFARWSNDANVYETWLGFETGAATSNAQSSGEVPVLATMGPTTPESSYAQGDDGSVLWASGSAIIDDGGASVIRAARFAWLVDNGKATAFDPKANLDVETYNPPLGWGTRVAGPIAWVDGSTALVLAVDAAANAQTSVQVAVKTPTPQLAQGRRYVVPIGVGQVAAAASGGFAYVLANDAPDSATLHAFAPACAQ